MIYQSVFADWVNDIRETGGVSDCPRDVSNAFKAAKCFCYSEIEKRGLDINPVIDHLVKFEAHFNLERLTR